MAISKAKQVAELVKGVNATLKARANAGKVQQMTKDSVIPKDINGFFDDAIGKKFPTVEADFVTTADKMSFAKSGLNASLNNKRRLARAVENWNRNKSDEDFFN